MKEKTETELIVFRVNMYVLELIYCCIVDEMNIFHKNNKKKNIDKRPFYEIMKTQPTTFSKYKNSDDKTDVTKTMLDLKNSCKALGGVFEGTEIIKLPNTEAGWENNFWNMIESGKKPEAMAECRDKVRTLVRDFMANKPFEAKNNAYHIVKWMQEQIQNQAQDRDTKNDRIIENTVKELKNINVEQLNSCHIEKLEILYKELERVSTITVTIKKYRDLMEKHKKSIKV